MTPVTSKPELAASPVRRALLGRLAASLVVPALRHARMVAIRPHRVQRFRARPVLDTPGVRVVGSA